MRQMRRLPWRSSHQLSGVVERRIRKHGHDCTMPEGVANGVNVNLSPYRKPFAREQPSSHAIATVAVIMILPPVQDSGHGQEKPDTSMQNICRDHG